MLAEPSPAALGRLGARPVLRLCAHGSANFRSPGIWAFGWGGWQGRGGTLCSEELHFLDCSCVFWGSLEATGEWVAGTKRTEQAWGCSRAAGTGLAWRGPGTPEARGGGQPCSEADIWETAVAAAGEAAGWPLTLSLASATSSQSQALRLGLLGPSDGWAAWDLCVSRSPVQATLFWSAKRLVVGSPKPGLGPLAGASAVAVPVAGQC